MFRTLLAASLLLLTLNSPTQARIDLFPITVIKNDLGGNIGSYVESAKKLAKDKAFVVIDGKCESACLLYFAYIPWDHICATKNAVLGFHMASESTFDNKTNKIIDSVPNVGGTKWWIQQFPLQMRKWILDNHVMESTTMSFVSGPILKNIVPMCEQ